jgi:phage FluMu protein Com
MGRQIINNIECGFCHKNFDVATEDIEWEHQNDAGATEEDSTVLDFSAFQTVDCPYCGKANKIVMHAKGKSESQSDTMKVISLEINK